MSRWRKVFDGTADVVAMPELMQTACEAAQPRDLFLAAEDDRQPVLAAADDDDLRVAARGQLLRGLDPLPLEELGADALCDDPLEVGDPLRLDALALGFLLLFLQHELHLLRFLLAAQLLLDRVRDERRQADLPQQHLLHDDAALPGEPPEQVEDLARDPLALGR